MIKVGVCDTVYALASLYVILFSYVCVEAAVLGALQAVWTPLLLLLLLLLLFLLRLLLRLLLLTLLLLLLDWTPLLGAADVSAVAAAAAPTTNFA